MGEKTKRSDGSARFGSVRFGSEKSRREKASAAAAGEGAAAAHDTKHADMPIQDLFASLADNPYFGAGFGLVGVGAGVATLRRGYQYGTVLFKRNCMITMEVPCRDKSYQWLLQWITQNARNTQHLSVETHFEQHETGKISTFFSFVPSVGTHFFQYKGNWIKVERKRETQSLDLQMGIPYETVVLTSIGRDKGLYFRILEEGDML